MRVVVVSDTHFCENRQWDETVRVHKWIAEWIHQGQPNLVVHCGDVYDSKSTPVERREVAGWIQSITKICPMYIVRGNHDAPRDLELMSRLETKHPVFVEEAASIQRIDTSFGGGPIAMVGVAWPRQGDVYASGVDGTKALQSMLAGFSDEVALLSKEMPCLVASHAMVRGSMTDLGQPKVGLEFELGVEDLALPNAMGVVLGHIHKPQEWIVGDVPVIMTGSSRSANYGEPWDKSFLLLNLEEGHPMTWERVQTPTTPMVLATASWDPEAGQLTLEGDASTSGADVRVRYQVPVEQLAAARVAAEWLRSSLLAAGAVRVTMEPVPIVTKRARTPELAVATSTWEQLQTLWRSRGIVMSEQQVSQIMEKLSRIGG